MTAELGILKRVELRDVWPHEEYHFTPWLAEPANLAVLSDTLGLDLELIGLEVPVGPYSADIVCTDVLTNTPVLIENQLAKTDHLHLGQILTYAAGRKAQTIIWIASRFTEEHRAAIDWLNEITHEEWQFFGLEIELWCIGTSVPAPRFNVVCRPNDWSRAVREKAASTEGNSPTRAFQLRFWTAFKDYRAALKQGAPKPSAQSWQSFKVGRTGFSLEGVVRHAENQLAVRLYINCADLPIKSVFRYLQARQVEIHAALGFPLVWDELPEGKGSVAFVVRPDCHLDDEAAWPAYMDWLSSTLGKMESVFRPLVKPLQPADLAVEAVADQQIPGLG